MGLLIVYRRRRRRHDLLLRKMNDIVVGHDTVGGEDIDFGHETVSRDYVREEAFARLPGEMVSQGKILTQSKQNLSPKLVST